MQRILSPHFRLLMKYKHQWRILLLLTYLIYPPVVSNKLARICSPTAIIWFRKMKQSYSSYISQHPTTIIIYKTELNYHNTYVNFIRKTTTTIQLCLHFQLKVIIISAFHFIVYGYFLFRWIALQGSDVLNVNLKTL